MTAIATLPGGTRIYHSKATKDVGAFVNGLRSQLKKPAMGVALDSASVSDFMDTAANQSASLIGFDVPEKLRIVRDELNPEQFASVLSAMLDGAAFYEREHGCQAPADLMEAVIWAAYSTSRHAEHSFGLMKSSGMVLDSADSLSSDPIALQTNRAVTAILNAFLSLPPFVLSLPFDLGSNQAKLAIVSHQAGLANGQYGAGDNMDGANSGDIYFSSYRVHTGTRGTPSGNAVTYTGKITRRQTDRLTCDQSADPLPLLKGRAIVYINGQPAAAEVSPGVISGSITVGSVTYTQSGTITNSTGAFNVTVTASSGGALGASVPVTVQGVIDYENNDALLPPSLNTHIDTFTILANPWRGVVQVSPDAATQMANELGIDPASQSMVAMGNQVGNERHYTALSMAGQLAQQNTDTFDFDWTDRKLQLNAAMIFNDMALPINRLSQQMALDTMSYGIKYWYVGIRVAALLMALASGGSGLFVPSGLAPRPGIYRLGTLMGIYEVYYCPKKDIVVEDPTTANILFIGQALEAARAPIVYGDAVAPIIKALGVLQNMKQGFWRYERNFTAVNPHAPSSKGCASLQITDLSV
jgi:uncharacterized Zn-binding protein involved in type VI secretion